MEPARTLRELLVRNRDLRLLWLGNLISVCGGWFSSVAVFAMVYAHSGAGLAAGLTLAVRYLPGVLAGLWGGVLADRADRRAVMLAADVVMAALAAAFLLADDPGRLWLVYPLTFASAAAGFVFQSARNAWMPSLARPEEYPLYSAAVQVNGLVFQALGGAAGGVVVTVVGWRWAFVVNAVSFLASAWLTWRVRAGDRFAGSSRQGWWRSLREGIAIAARTRVLAALLLLEAIFCLGLGGTITAMTYLALRVHDLGEGGTGWFYAVQGVVGVATLIPAAARIRAMGPRGRRLVIGLSCLAEGVLTMLLGLPAGVAGALALWGLVSAAEVVYGPAAMTTLLGASGNETRGRITSLWSATATLSLGVSAAATGALLDRAGVAPTFAVLGLLMAAGGVVWLVAVRPSAAQPAMSST
ncbi:MFS family permease [Thermocatellispora tengchongensis]|uniref:MFS family permease n=1 Tax=Thermocatellispora tengchongensis TaxID=1073253 RepID=A0A840P6M1_9ACTN|nr:MFS transporter [Thermocatellispora tengchongensis]MBB5134972.1 MFS family permease [Thermocatellispora tengchongensis]